MTVGERITYARKQKKLTQANLSRAASTSSDIIGKYERDEIKPSIDTAVKIADALGVTLNYLVQDKQYQNIFALMNAFFAKNKLQSLLQ